MKSGLDRRALIGGALFGALAVVGVPTAAFVCNSPGRVLRSGPVRAVLSPFQGIADERALERIEAMAPAIAAAAARARVEPELVGAIVFAESRGVSGQTSSAGALGLMQLVPAAARDAARRSGQPVPDDPDALRRALLFDDELNLGLGAAHLAWLLEHRGDWPDEAVLVSYNAGRRRLFDWIEAAGGSYGDWVRAQDARLARGERTSGALTYARGVLAVRDTLRERGRIGITAR